MIHLTSLEAKVAKKMFKEWCARCFELKIQNIFVLKKLYQKKFNLQHSYGKIRNFWNFYSRNRNKHDQQFYRITLCLLINSW